MTTNERPPFSHNEPTDAETDAADVANEQWLNQRRPKTVDEVLSRKLAAGEVAVLPAKRIPLKRRPPRNPAHYRDEYSFDDEPVRDDAPPTVEIDTSSTLIELPTSLKPPPQPTDSEDE